MQGTSENAHPYLQKEHRLLLFVDKVLSFSQVNQNIKAKDSATNLITDIRVLYLKKKLSSISDHSRYSQRFMLNC